MTLRARRDWDKVAAMCESSDIRYFLKRNWGEVVVFSRLFYFRKLGQDASWTGKIGRSTLSVFGSEWVSAQTDQVGDWTGELGRRRTAQETQTNFLYPLSEFP